jgi:DNA-binding MarR family transcriptional regulator
MNVMHAIRAGESFFTRYALGDAVDLPKAARRVFEALHYLRRKGREINVTIAELCEQCGVKRRCITKGLAQLEAAGKIRRDKCMAFGRRTITFLVKFAGESKREAKPRPGAPNRGDPNADPVPIGEALAVPTQDADPDRPGTARKICEGMRLLGWRPVLTGDDKKMAWQKIVGAIHHQPDHSVRAQLRAYFADIVLLLEQDHPSRE